MPRVTHPNATSFTSESGKQARGSGPIVRGRTQLNQPEERELRGQQLVQARLAGLPIREAAPLVGLSQRQAEKELKWMRRTGRIQKMEAKVVTLVPKAIEVARQGLEKGDVKVALKILDLLLRLGDRAEARSSKEGERQASLEDHLTKLQMRAAYEASRLAGTDDPTGIEEPVVAIEVPAALAPPLGERPHERRESASPPDDLEVPPA
jgi:hypothetical protein